MLKAENIIIPNKKISFNKSVIHSILTNERYTGDSILQKTVTVDCISKIRRKNQGEAPMYYVRNSHPAIISREKFNKVQEEMARRKVKRPQMNSSSISKSGRYSRNPLSEVTVCEECGSRYKRCTWAKNGKKKIVWRCSNRLEHGTKYFHESPTIDEKELKEAVVRAVNKFSNEDETTYTTLMNATIDDAIGLNKEFESITILENRIESLNKKMMDLINDSIRSGADIEVHEEEFKYISEEITQLENRIKTIQEMSASNDSAKERILELQKIIKEHESTTDEYNETIVRQMVECIKVHKDKRIEVIFGGGISFFI